MGEYSHDATHRSTRNRYDYDETNPVVAVVETLAEALDRETTDQSTLFEHVDPDALDKLLTSSSDSEHVTTVSFTVGDRRVTAGSDGFVVVMGADHAP